MAGLHYRVVNIRVVNIKPAVVNIKPAVVNIKPAVVISPRKPDYCDVPAVLALFVPGSLDNHVLAVDLFMGDHAITVMLPCCGTD